MPRPHLNITRIFLELFPDNSTGMTWCIILLLKAITRRKHCCHEQVHLVFKNVLVAHKRQCSMVIVGSNVLDENIPHSIKTPPRLVSGQICIREQGFRWKSPYSHAPVDMMDQKS